VCTVAEIALDLVRVHLFVHDVVQIIYNASTWNIKMVDIIIRIHGVNQESLKRSCKRRQMGKLRYTSCGVKRRQMGKLRYT